MDVWDKAAAAIEGTDFAPTDVLVYDADNTRHAGKLQLCTFVGSDMASVVGMMFAVDGGVLRVVIADPHKVVAQIIKADIQANHDNKSLEQPVDLSSVHSRSRTTTPHRPQRTTAKKPRRGRK